MPSWRVYSRCRCRGPSSRMALEMRSGQGDFDWSRQVSIRLVQQAIGQAGSSLCFTETRLNQLLKRVHGLLGILSGRVYLQRGAAAGR